MKISIFLFFSSLSLTIPVSIQREKVELKYGNTSYILHKAPNGSSSFQSSQPLVVFFHGLAVSMDFYVPLLKHHYGRQQEEQGPLSSIQSYDWLIFDWYGMGDSDFLPDSVEYSYDNLCNQAHDLIVKITGSNYPEIILVGHSMGGLLAAYYASRGEANVKNLILLNPGGHHLAFDDLKSLAALPVLLHSAGKHILTQSTAISLSISAVKLVSFLLSKADRILPKSILYHAKGNIDLIHRNLENDHACYKRVVSSLLSNLNLYESSSRRSIEIYQSVKCPCSVILCEQDMLVPLHLGTRLTSEYMLHSELFIVKSHGHMGPYLDPEIFYDFLFSICEEDKEVLTEDKDILREDKEVLRSYFEQNGSITENDYLFDLQKRVHFGF